MKYIVFDEYMLISIHAPRVGSDQKLEIDYKAVRISIHAPRVGSDVEQISKAFGLPIFQSTLPVWGATFSI